MSHLKVYGPRAGSGLRNYWMLEEVGAAYEQINIDMRAGEHRSEDFLKLNPTGQVPVLRDGDFILTESLAINDYLAEKFKPEMAGTTPEERARVCQWSLWAIFNIQKYFSDIAMETVWFNTNNDYVVSKAQQGLERFLPIMEKRLSETKYLAGDTFTIADINVGAGMGYAKYINYDLSKYPNIVKWMSEITSRPAFIKAMGN